MVSHTSSAQKRAGFFDGKSDAEINEMIGEMSPNLVMTNREDHHYHSAKDALIQDGFASNRSRGGAGGRLRLS